MLTSFIIPHSTLFSAFSQFVVLVHRVVDALQYKALDDVDRHVDGRLQHLHVVVGVMAEHPVDLSATWIVVADAHSQAREVLADQLHDMSQTIMPSIASIGFQPEITQGQCHIITDDEQPTLVDFLLIEPIAHSIAAEVHEGSRLQQEYLSAFQGRLSHKAVTAILKTNIGRFSKSVQYHKSCIVASTGVFITGITQTTDQILIQCLSISVTYRDGLLALSLACCVCRSVSVVAGCAGVGVTCHLHGANDHVLACSELQTLVREAGLP